MVPVQSTLEVKSEPSFIQHVQLDNQSKDGQGPLASTSNTSTNEIHNNVSQGYTGQGTLAPSSFYNPIIVQGSAIPNKPPFWSYNVPPPGVQQNNGSTVPSTAVFHPGSNKDTSNIPSIPVHLNTPVVMPSHVQSLNNTSDQTKSEATHERHRGRGRKRCQRESSSSSDESIDRESSRWKESHTRERSKAPQLPKMPVFTGSGNLSWEAFVYQFERTANRRNWDDAKKTCRFLDCLSEVALEYARRSHISRYDDLRKYMKRRFSKKEEASAARRQLQYIRQLDGETVEEYAERVHFLTMDGYYRSNNDIIDQLGTEAFLRGCQEKEAARIVIEKNPRTINEALKWIKSSLANQKAIYGARKSYSGRPQSYSQRQVTFSDINDSDHSPQRPTALQHGQVIEKVDNSLQTDIKDLVSLVGKLLKDGRSNQSSSPERHREYYNSPSRRPQSNYARSPTPPRSQSKFRSPQNSRSPSPHRGPRSKDLVLELIKRSDFKPDRVRPLGSRLTHEEEPLNELVVRRTVGRSLVIPAAVNSTPVKATIDTAAMITLVSSSLISHIQENCESVVLKGIGPQPVIGKLIKNTAISIGHTTMYWDVCVIDMTDTIILGLDFLNACSAVVDLVHMSVVLNGESIPAQLVGGNNQSLSEVLLSRSVKVLQIQLRWNLVDEILDDNLSTKDTYSIKQVHLPPGNFFDQKDKPLPDHLQNLYDRSITNLKDDQISTLRDHVLDFEGVTACLYELAHQKGQPVWEDCHEHAFLNIKELLTLPPCLAYPNTQDLFILDTDAPDIAIGAVLSQLQDGQEKVICYASHVLMKPQRKYCTTRKELLSVVKFCRHFRHYLLGRRFVLRTDHNSLVWLMRFKHIEGQLARWLEELAQFDMEIVHRPGKKHLNADGLSRIPDCLEDCDCYNAGADVENLPCKGCQYCQRAHTQWSRFLNDVDDVIPLAKRQVSPLEVKIVRLQASSFNSADSIDHDMTQPNTEEDTIHINWMQSYSPQQLRQLQLQDPDLFPLIEWIESQYDPSDAELRLQSPATRALRLLGSCLKVIDGVLYYKWINQSGRTQ
ncbi:unnamed protein product [Mytilus edulis]|uniref:RNA-directed DNA polymerase n=1 Tax=Mytilus edulis TaxID=6550 RepID=A0A8S3V0K7_MYTED|nr:unnamed protein product [Mytilus edulis]